MHPRTQEILTLLDSHLAGLRAAIDDVAADRRHERPSPDRWSVAEIVEHVAMAERSITKAAARHLAAAKEAGLRAETEAGSILDALPAERIANRTRRLAAPDRLQPKGLDVDAAWQEVESSRAALRALILSADGLALGEVSFPHPALGPLTLYQWFLFAAGHHARHAAQIREIGAAL